MKALTTSFTEKLDKTIFCDCIISFKDKKSILYRKAIASLQQPTDRSFISHTSRNKDDDLKLG